MKAQDWEIAIGRLSERVSYAQEQVKKAPDDYARKLWTDESEVVAKARDGLEALRAVLDGARLQELHRVTQDTTLRALLAELGIPAWSGVTWHGARPPTQRPARGSEPGKWTQGEG